MLCVPPDPKKKLSERTVETERREDEKRDTSHQLLEFKSKWKHCGDRRLTGIANMVKMKSETSLKIFTNFKLKKNNDKISNSISLYWILSNYTTQDTHSLIDWLNQALLMYFVFSFYQFFRILGIHRSRCWLLVGTISPEFYVIF